MDTKTFLELDYVARECRLLAELLATDEEGNVDVASLDARLNLSLESLGKVVSVLVGKEVSVGFDGEPFGHENYANDNFCIFE